MEHFSQKQKTDLERYLEYIAQKEEDLVKRDEMVRAYKNRLKEEEQKKKDELLAKQRWIA